MTTPTPATSVALPSRRNMPNDERQTWGALFAREYRRGVPVAAIARAHGCSHPTIRGFLAEVGITPSQVNPRIAERRATQRQLAASLYKHPGATTRTVAKAMGVSAPTISRWLTKEASTS